MWMVVRIDVRAGMHTEVCMRWCVLVAAGMYAGMCIDMCVDGLMDGCEYLCTDVFADICMKM